MYVSQHIISYTARVHSKVPPIIITKPYYHMKKMEAVCVSGRLKATKRDCIQGEEGKGTQSGQRAGLAMKTDSERLDSM